MQEYYFKYRDGEILVTVKANSLREAFGKLYRGVDVEYEVQFDMLWEDFWSFNDELLVDVNQELVNGNFK